MFNLDDLLVNDLLEGLDDAIDDMFTPNSDTDIEVDSDDEINISMDDILSELDEILANF